MDLREVPRLVWVLAAGRFLSSAGSFLILFLTLYLTGPRDLPVTSAGLLAGAYGVGLLLGNFTGGRFGDRLGHSRVVLTGSTLAGAGIATVPWQPLWLLPLSLPVLAYVAATAGVSVGALSALAVGRGDRRTSVAIGRAASNAGFVIGPPLGALLVSQSYDAVFVVDGAMTILVRLLLAPFLPRERRAAPIRSPRVGERRVGLLRALRADRGLQRLLPAVVMVDLVYRQLYTTLPLRLRDAGEPVALYTAMIAVGSGLILLLEIPVAQRLRRLPAYPIIATGYGLVGVGFALFGLPISAVTAILAMVVLTAGEILYKTTATAHVLDAAPDHLVGQYQGLYTGAATSGTMLAGPVGTSVYAAAPALLWPLCLAVAAGGAVLVLGGASRVGRADDVRSDPSTSQEPP